MFKKVPYGVKVRIKGNGVTGYRVQRCISYNRFIPFLNIWSDIAVYNGGNKTVVFDTLEAAQKVAMKDYDTWIDYYKRCEEEAKQTKKISNKVVWEYP